MAVILIYKPLLMSDKITKLDCAQCQHYYITWDKERPYGCRFFGFKSPSAPWLSVIESSGQSCHAFCAKTQQTLSSQTTTPKKDGWTA
jgi:hypothetical protein